MEIDLKEGQAPMEIDCGAVTPDNASAKHLDFAAATTGSARVVSPIGSRFIAGDASPTSVTSPLRAAREATGPKKTTVTVPAVSARRESCVFEGLDLESPLRPPSLSSRHSLESVVLDGSRAASRFDSAEPFRIAKNLQAKSTGRPSRPRARSACRYQT